MIDLITAEKTTIEIFNYYLEKLPLEEGCVCRCLKEKWMVLTPTPGISDLFDHLIRAGMLYALRHPDAIHVVEQARDPPGEE